MRESKNFQTRPEKTDPRRSAWSFVSFDDCKKGETSAKTGCTPASGEGGKDEKVDTPEQQKIKEELKEARQAVIDTPTDDPSFDEKAEKVGALYEKLEKEEEGKEGEGPHEYSDDYLDKIKEGFSKEEWSGAMKELGSANKEGHVGEDASEYSEKAGATADALSAADKYEIDPNQENFDEMNKKFDELRQVVDKEKGEGEKKEGEGEGTAEKKKRLDSIMDQRSALKKRTEELEDTLDEIESGEGTSREGDWTAADKASMEDELGNNFDKQESLEQEWHELNDEIKEEGEGSADDRIEKEKKGGEKEGEKSMAERRAEADLPPFNQENNPEDYFPDEGETDTEAFNRYGEEWNDLGSKEQDAIADDLIAEFYKGTLTEKKAIEKAEKKKEVEKEDSPSEGFVPRPELENMNYDELVEHAEAFPNIADDVENITEKQGDPDFPYDDAEDMLRDIVEDGIKAERSAIESGDLGAINDRVQHLEEKMETAQERGIFSPDRDRMQKEIDELKEKRKEIDQGTREKKGGGWTYDPSQAEGPKGRKKEHRENRKMDLARGVVEPESLKDHQMKIDELTYEMEELEGDIEGGEGEAIKKVEEATKAMEKEYGKVERTADGMGWKRRSAEKKKPKRGKRKRRI